MTKSKAVEILNKQIVKLEQSNFNYPTWNIQTKTYLENFFGNGSEQHEFFNRYFWNVESTHSGGITIEVKKHIASTFLQDCIDTIDDIRIPKPEPRGNFLTRISDRWAVAIIFGAISLSFWLGAITGS